MYVKLSDMPRRTASDAARTHDALIEEGVRYFSQHGYAETALDDLVAGLGMSRGALYHHFGSKEALFEAVVERVMQGLAQRIVASAEKASEPWRGLLAGCEAFLEAAIDPAFRQIVLLDAAAILGWARWKEIDDRTTSKTLQEGLRALRRAGVLSARDLGTLTTALSGAMNELALWVATQDSRERALRRAKRTLRQILEALRSQDGS